MFETTADRLAYLTTFGEDVDFIVGIYSWSGTAIFDNEFVDVDGVESRHPVLLCRLDDIYKPGELQNIGFRATSLAVWAGGYNVVEVQEDGTGMVMLVLELQ